MEPKNEGLEYEYPFQRGDIDYWASMLVFGGQNILPKYASFIFMQSHPINYFSSPGPSQLLTFESQP